MADNSNNILKQLQQHTMQPPADAFEKAWERCMHESAEDTADRNAFGKLKDFGLNAPDIDLKKIMSGEKAVVEKKKTFAIPAAWMRAAVVLLLIGAGTILYIIMYNKKDAGESYAAAEEIKNTPAAKNNDSNIVAAINIDSESGPKNNSLISNAGSKNFAGTNVAAVKKNKIGSRGYTGNENSFTYNDVFYTLVNYKESGRDKWFYKILSAKKITLNQYSYINLSDKMVAMLQELYLTKRNGKTARKAKKAKRKFDKWRKKDEKYFDKKTDKNPADIIDLSDFLMYN